MLSSASRFWVVLGAIVLGFSAVLACKFSGLSECISLGGALTSADLATTFSQCAQRRLSETKSLKRSGSRSRGKKCIRRTS